MRIIRSVLSSWIGHKNNSASAAIAFFTIFSITPLLAIGVGAAGLFISKAHAQKEIVEQIAKIASPEAAAIVKTVLSNFKVKTTGGLASSILIIVMIYSASMVFDELRTALNRIFGARRHETKKDQFLIFIKARIISGLFAFSAGILAVANFFVSTTLTVVAELIKYFPGIIKKASLVWIGFLNQSVSFLIVSIIFYCFFRFLPQRRPSIKNLIPGILTSVILFESGKYLLKLYLTKNMLMSSFGAGGTLVAAILWVYYSVQTILLGAEVSNYFESREMHRLPKSKRKMLKKDKEENLHQNALDQTNAQYAVTD